MGVTKNQPVLLGQFGENLFKKKVFTIFKTLKRHRNYGYFVTSGALQALFVSEILAFEVGKGFYYWIECIYSGERLLSFEVDPFFHLRGRGAPTSHLPKMR